MFEEVHYFLKNEPALRDILRDSTIRRTKDEKTRVGSYRAYHLCSTKVAQIEGLPEERLNDEQLEAAISEALQREYHGAFSAKVPVGTGIVKIKYTGMLAENQAKQFLLQHHRLNEIIEKMKSA